MALQLVACGTVSSGGDEREPGEPARPERAVDGAPATTASSPGVGGIGVLRERGGRGGSAVRSDAHPADPEPTPDREPVVTPDGAWETARCAGAATRHVRIAANLDAEMGGLLEPFSAERPAATSFFSTSFAGFDDQGRSQSVSVYFGPVEHGRDYHAVLDGTAFVIGEGQLSFDEQGVVTVKVNQELRLLTPSGPGHAVELDLSGVTRLAGPSEVIAQEADGAEARWGNACATSEPLSPEAAVTGPHCASAATTRLALRANLAAATPIANEPWDRLSPTADFTLPLQANDAQGALIDFELHLRKSSAETWDYHVLLLGDVPGQEVATGSLDFNPNGSLRSVATARPLRFPNHDGVLGDPIELDFGAGTAAGGSGVDGITSLPGGSFDVGQHADGAVLDCVPRAPSTPLPLPHPLSCAGERTTAVRMGFNLDPATALSDTAPYAASVTVYDAALAPHELELHFQHVEPLRWQCQVIASSTKIGVVDLHFTAGGGPSLIENIPTLRLPLADGSVGPPIDLGFVGEDWIITSFPIESEGWLAPNGAAPHADGCVD